MTQSNFIPIEKGPGKFDLIVGYGQRKEVVFTIEGGKKISVLLETLQMEDGSGESWNLQGTSKQFPIFDAYYTTRGNSGTISLDHPVIEIKRREETMAHWIIEDTVVADSNTARFRIRRLPPGEEPNSMGFIYGPFTSPKEAEKERDHLIRIRKEEGWEVV